MVCAPSSAVCCLQMKTSDMAGAIRSDRQNLKMQVGAVGHIACLKGWGWQSAECSAPCSGVADFQQRFLTAAARAALTKSCVR